MLQAVSHELLEIYTTRSKLRSANERQTLRRHRYLNFIR